MEGSSRSPRLREERQPSKLARVFRHRDFRYLWTGAFFSFIGSWVQKIAEGWLVYRITGNAALLGLVVFFASLPTAILGPIAGTLADTFDRKKLLVITQAIFAAGAFYLAAATYYNFVTYWQIVVVAVILGIVSTVEQPARQSTVSACVPPEDLPLAIPINAMTFNLSRLIGPAIGGVLLAAVGPASCYFVNGLSFFALIFAALAIKADLSPKQREPQPVKDLLMEGALYTFRDRRLRNLFILESIVSLCGLTYITLLPAIIDRMLHRVGDIRGGTHDRFLQGSCSFAVGVGSVIALSIIMKLSDRGVRALMIRLAMTGLGVALIALSFVRNEWLAYPAFAVLGMCAITHFNLTNTLFQTMAPPRLRGRVLAMHIWALNGLGPFGILAFGYVAEGKSVPSALALGGSLVLVGAIWAWFDRFGLEGVDSPESFYGMAD